MSGTPIPLPHRSSACWSQPNAAGLVVAYVVPLVEGKRRELDRRDVCPGGPTGLAPSADPAGESSTQKHSIAAVDLTRADGGPPDVGVVAEPPACHACSTHASASPAGLEDQPRWIAAPSPWPVAGPPPRLHWLPLASADQPLHLVDRGTRQQPWAVATAATVHIPVDNAPGCPQAARNGAIQPHPGPR